MEQQTGFKLGKEFVKAVYCQPAYLTYMQSTSCKMLGWMKHKLESRFPGEISITSDTQRMPPTWQKRRTKEPLSFSSRGSLVLRFCHVGGILCVSEVIDISPGNLDSS